MLRIGIDVGGTNCDAVLLDGDRLIASTKTLTTPDVTDCITTALGNLQSASGFDPAQIAAVMIGTTHFINALLEGKHLERTAAIRFALPATAALPPLVDWPQPLLDTIGELSYLCHGGFEYDGRQAAPFDEAEFRGLRRFGSQCGRPELRDFVDVLTGQRRVRDARRRDPRGRGA